MAVSESLYGVKFYLLPKELYVKGANLHFPALREELTVLTQEQADNVGAKIEG